MYKFFILSMISMTAFAGTTYKGKIRNLTSYPTDEVTVKLTRTCDWFCSVRYWESNEVPMKPDGSWMIKSPHSPGGVFSLQFKASKKTSSHRIFYDDFNAKVIQTTLVETYPAKIPVNLLSGGSAGPWIQNVVANRKIELFEDFSQNLSPGYREITGPYLEIPAVLFAYLGFKDLQTNHSLATALPKGSHTTTVELRRSITLNRDLYTSIPEIIVDNSLDDPLFDGTYSGEISPADYNYKSLKGEIEASCHEGILEGVFSTTEAVTKFRGSCGLGFAKFDLELEFTAIKPEGVPQRKLLHFSSDSITGNGVYFLQRDSSGYNFNGNFHRLE
jgi:hypothetical protein